MPIYEYGCQTCGNEFEAKQRITDPPIEKCPGCGNSVQRLISHSSFVLKGSGWYATDYARKNGCADRTDGKGPGEGKTTGKEGGSGDGDGKAKSSTPCEKKDSCPAASSCGTD